MANFQSTHALGKEEYPNIKELLDTESEHPLIWLDLKCLCGLLVKKGALKRFEEKQQMEKTSNNMGGARTEHPE